MTQTTGTQSASLATGVATAAQAAAQVLPEAAPQQPAVPPPAPPLPVAPLPATPLPPVVPSIAIASAALPPPISVGAEGDDAPRHGAPDFGGGKTWRASVAAKSSAASVIHVRAAFRKTLVRTVSVIHVRTIRVVKTVQHTARAPHVGGAVPPRPFPPAPLHEPAPNAIAPALTETHDPGSFTTFALGAGALGAFLLVLLGYLAPGLQTVRSQPGRAHPDPPG